MQVLTRKSSEARSLNSNETNFGNLVSLVFYGLCVRSNKLVHMMNITIFVSFFSGFVCSQVCSAHHLSWSIEILYYAQSTLAGSKTVKVVECSYDMNSLTENRGNSIL
ncbi:hypothetical protein Patl1_08355 [Pistacia atlantica]|uniref:Uncharacterized protein n=1 Tax=Pistacia atlantica TaxID=434234 RepID=A0ACC1AER7_9ROSI|nr:hypothetical protein Patl1_08355 [Pistacia atlantica]